MRDLAFLAFLLALLGLGLRRPFLLVLVYVYIDIVSPQRLTYYLLNVVPISLIAVLLAVAGWALADDKRGLRLAPRQLMIAALLVYCGLTTLTAEFALEAQEKWDWVWKALAFAAFLPLTLRTRLRIEALLTFMILSASSIIIVGGIKTLASGGGYGQLNLMVDNNSGLYEGSTISTVAVAIVPLIAWVARHGTILGSGFGRRSAESGDKIRPYPSGEGLGWGPSSLPIARGEPPPPTPPLKGRGGKISPWPARAVTLFCFALGFACLLIPIGTSTRTGLLCIGLVALLSLRSVKRRGLYLGAMAVAALIAVPLLPSAFMERMSTIGTYQADESASTRIAVWQWTWDFAKSHPFGGGFEAYRGNRIVYDLQTASTPGGGAVAAGPRLEIDQGRAYHSAYFEMLGEQGYPGVALWLLINLAGLWRMEVLRRRYRDGGDAWAGSLAAALQTAQLVYLLGAGFIAIAFQPFIYMLIGAQIGLDTYLARQRSASTERGFRKGANRPGSVEGHESSPTARWPSTGPGRTASAGPAGA
ncbi:DUF5935 domain-containing protein [Sphingomonas sp.]|uniref:DUF5935 domain-containing protein n=1 Tax=Sphingomonas sp. TaxID=28214 RepID=UPI003CC5D647